MEDKVHIANSHALITTAERREDKEDNEDEKKKKKRSVIKVGLSA
jgi:hypothetical protein